MLDDVIMLVSVSESWYYFSEGAWEYITIINWQKLLAVINTNNILKSVLQWQVRVYSHLAVDITLLLRALSFLCGVCRYER